MDDTSSIRELIIHTLRCLVPYEVVAVTDATAALAVLAARPVSLMITDYHLADMLGPPALVHARRSTMPSWYPNRALLSALQHARPHPLMFVLISFADASVIIALGAHGDAAR